MSTKQESKTTVSHLPEHGPIDENGREILLQVKNVDITFGKGDDAVKAVKNASFDIYKGETFSLVGESGSGKTTIGRAVIRVNPCSAGEILYKGVKISGKIPHSLDREVIRNIQMVFQDPAASLNERATVDYIVSEGLYNFHLYENEADRVKKVEEIIEEVGTDGFIAVENRVNSSLEVDHSIIATGGSVVYGKEAMEHLKSIGTVVYLQLPFEELNRRLSDIKGRGVVLKDGQTLKDLYEERVPLYEKYADITVNEYGLNVEQTIDKILSLRNEKKCKK